MGLNDLSSDEEMLSTMARTKRKIVRKAIIEESSDEAEFNDTNIIDADNDDSDDDSEDDIPIAALKRKREALLKKAKVAAKSSSKRKTIKKATPAKAKVKVKATTPKRKKPVKISSNATASSEIYTKTNKGKLIQSVLCRWWYCMEWPEKHILSLPVPFGCDPLQGFPGVHIHTRGESVGKIVDLRDMKTCPSFKNFAKKESQELVTLLQTAVDNQIEELRKHEGGGTVTEAALDNLKKWAKKINCSKADKEADKVLRVAGMSLP